MKKRILLVSMLAVGLTSAYGQNWGPARQRTSEIRKDVEVKQAYHVDLTSLRNLLKDAVETGKGAKPVIISLPTADGKIEKFAVYSNPVMEKSLANRYELGSYVGAGIDDPSKYVRFSTSPADMQSMIIKDGVFQFIEPISADKKTYGVFYKTKRTAGEHGFECTTDEKEILDIKTLKKNGKKNLSNVGITSRPASTKYRTYRLAISVTGEYTQFHGGTVAGALTAINNTMSRVNGVYEKDFGIHLMVQDLPGIIYTNPATDPYSNAANNRFWSSELANTLSTTVGSGLFDIGHLFGASGGGGFAGCIGCVCSNDTTLDSHGIPSNYKGAGYTSPANNIPQGDSFDIDFVAHEMGHQFGGNHTFSHISEGSGVNIEPGGGTTIMGYAGITGDDVQENSDAYFHYSSINQVLNNLDSKPGCGVSQDITTNTAPVISPLTAYSIPKGTAYYLDAVATDSDPVKYTWEQYDSVGDLNSISGDNGWGYNLEGALTRSYFGTASGRRYFPSLPLVMDGILTNKTVFGSMTNPSWETVSYVPRTLHYAVTVRDENATRPMLASAETTVTVGNDGPFKFAGLTSSSVLYNNSSNTIQWDVANTNAAPYNVAAVKIDYTSDNGTTWIDLVTSTPNTGSYSVQMPANLSGSIKLRISAIGNIFYAISPAVTIGTAPSSALAAPTGIEARKTEISKTTARVSWNGFPGATYIINYRKAGTTNWLNATSTTNSVVLTALEDETNYEVQVANVVNTVQGTFSNNYTFKTKGLQTGADYCLMTTGGNSFANHMFNSGLFKLKLSNFTYQDTAYKNIFRTYLDFSEDADKLINLTKGTQYTLSYTNVGNKIDSPDKLEAWIDYNRNGVFESSEKIGSKSGVPNSNAVHVGIITFTVPDDAYSGDKQLRMRVASTSFVTSSGPCGSPSYIEAGETYSYGSYKDFPVKITGGALDVKETNTAESGISIYPNPADTYVEVKNIKGKADYKIYSADGRLVQEGKLDGQRINVAALVKGVYVISITDEANTYSTKLIKK